MKGVDKHEIKHLLFVCVENSCRSQLAEAMARRGLPAGFEVHSAGSRPSGHIHPRAVEVMAELGYDLAAHKSRALTDVPDMEYAAVITMGCGDNCPWIRGKLREDWGLPDPKDLPLGEFRKLRDSIGIRVTDLFERLTEN